MAPPRFTWRGPSSTRLASFRGELDADGELRTELRGVPLLCECRELLVRS